MIRLEVLEHEKKEVANDHSDYDSMPVHLELVLGHLGELHLLVNHITAILRLLLVLSSPLARCATLLIFPFSPLPLGHIVEQEVRLRKNLRLEAVLFEELAISGEEIQASAPLGMKVDATRVFLVVGARGQQDAQDANDDDLGDGLVCRHVPLVESFDGVRGPQVEARRLVLGAEEHLNVLFQVEEVLVLANVLAFVVRSGLRIDDRRSGQATEEEPHVDVEDDEEFADGHDGELERDSHGFHTDFLDLDKLAVGELAGNGRVVVVVDHEIDQYVERQTQIVLQLVLVVACLSVHIVQLLE